MGLAIQVHRAAVFVLDEVHDDGIKSLPAAILEVLLRLFPGEADDRRRTPARPIGSYGEIGPWISI